MSAILRHIKIWAKTLGDAWLPRDFEESEREREIRDLRERIFHAPEW